MITTACVPTLNAEESWGDFSRALKAQTTIPDHIFVVDSESTDGTAEQAQRAGFNVVRILRKEFGHGKTRQMALALAPESEILLYLTQDAVLASRESISTLLRYFEDEGVGAVYGRQLPRFRASPIEAHARLFNYPSVPEVRTNKDVARRGFKVAFFSDSFGAYRRSALEGVGGFPCNLNFGEDTVVAGRLLLAGWKIAYAADAAVYHSHAHSIPDDFRRSRRVGELHATQPWMLQKFGAPAGEGARFVLSEMLYLVTRAPYFIPSALLRTACKVIGYKLGRYQRKGAVSWAPAACVQSDARVGTTGAGDSDGRRDGAP